MASFSDLQHHSVCYEISAPESGNILTFDKLKYQGIKFVRIQWVDLVNNIRIRVFPLPYFEKLLKTSRPGTSVAKVVLGIVFIATAEGFSPSGEYLYAIDPSSLRICPYAPGHASVMGYFEEKTPLPGLRGRLAIEVDLCPRTILRRVIEKAKNIFGIEFLVGFESEFILLEDTHPIKAVNQHGWCNSLGLPSGSKESTVLEEIADALEAAGIELQMYHPEGAPGQYEVVTGPLPPLQAVDALIHTRETIFNTASKYGLKATFAPRVFLDNCGSASHVHISIHGNSTSSSHPNMNSLESAFLAGLLNHLGSIALLCLPMTASYKRMMDGIWSGGTYVCWGTENKEAPVRLCHPGSPSSRNFELKTLDGTANPYLAIAAVLGAGIEGVVEGRKLEIADCEKGAALLGNEERAALGIKERLPLNWEDARTKFYNSNLVESLFGKEFKEKYLSVNMLLKEQMTSGLEQDEELKKLVENY